MLQKTGWYSESELFEKTRWRQLIPKGWSGSKPLQYCVPGMSYSSVMHVPSSKDSRLLRMMSKAEPRIAKITGYQIKFVEKPGRNLCNMFQKEASLTKCYRDDCRVCFNSDPKFPSCCQQKGVVYLGVCRLCDNEHKLNDKKQHKGIYVGETSRTLYERAKEHYASLKRLEDRSFMLKHWSTTHSDLNTPPEFKFKVMKKHSDALSRLVHEAVKIPKFATLNSKAEWGGV